MVVPPSHASFATLMWVQEWKEVIPVEEASGDQQREGNE
jgi:hypothetical protein